MVRDLTTAVKTELTATKKEPIFLFEALFDSGPLRLWTGYGDIPWDGKTWSGSGHLLSISPIEETTDVQAPGVVLILSGVPSSILTLVDGEDYQGRTCSIFFGFLNASGVVIVDPYEVIRGLMDVMEDVEDGVTATVTLRIENALVDLERPVERRYTPEDQKLVDASDTFFDYVADLQERPIVGKV